MSTVRPPNETVTFVLVPGFWLGGWAWDAVTDSLRGDGYVVDPITLPGLDGAAGEVTLDDQIAAVVHAVHRTDGRTIVVAHSGAGTVVSGVADAAHELIESLVFVDSGPMPHGFVASADLPDDAETIPLPPWNELEAGGSSLAGLRPDHLAQFRSGARPQPAAPTREALSLVDDGRYRVPITLICSSYTSQQVREMAASGHEWFQEIARYDSVDYVDLPTGHWPMWSRPEDLAAELGAIASRPAR